MAPAFGIHESRMDPSSITVNLDCRKAGWEACATSGEFWEVPRRTGISPVGSYQAFQ